MTAASQNRFPRDNQWDAKSSLEPPADRPEHSALLEACKPPVEAIGVVGYSGFIGQAVLRASNRRGLTANPVEIARIEVDSSEDPSLAVAAWQRSGLAWQLLVDQLRGVDAVINAAGSPDPDETDSGSLWSANVVLPLIVAAACKEAGVHRMVHISSATVQWPGPLDDTPRTSPFSAYSQSKADAERVLTGITGDGPTTIVIYRPTSVMGRERKTTERLCQYCARRVPAFTGDTRLPLAHVDNVGDAAVFLATVDDPPSIATHPWEGITVSDVVTWCGGRVYILSPAAKNLLVTAMLGVARARPSLRGPLARARVFLDGQDIQASAITSRGWVPPVPKAAYQQIFSRTRDQGPLRIAFLITRSDTLGGAHIHVRDLARSLLDLGHDVQVVVGAEGPYGESLRRLDIPVISVPALARDFDIVSDYKAYVQLKAIIVELQPEILSAHSSKAGVLGRLVGRRLGVPTLFTAHGWAFTAGVGRLKRIVYGAVEIAAAPLARGIVCVSEHDHLLARRVRIDRLTKTWLVPNAVRDASTDLRADPRVDPPRLIMVARLDRQKCQQEVLAALAQLSEWPFTIDFVGDGPRLEELLALAGDLGITNRCRFLGRRNDVDSLLAGAQIFVLMSNYEGMPRSILEAMRAGLPVVASRTAGVPEVVVDGETGLLVDPHDVQGLVNALRRLFDSPAFRAQVGNAGRSRYEARYKLGRLVTDMLDIYSEVVGRPLSCNEALPGALPRYVALRNQVGGTAPH